MTLGRVGRAIAIAFAALLGLLVVLWFVLRIAAPDLVRARALSDNGYYAETIVDGMPLSDGLRVIVWTPEWPHLNIFGCQVLESYHEQPTKLNWSGNILKVQHGYTAAQIVRLRDGCGDAHIQFAHVLKTYS